MLLKESHPKHGKWCSHSNSLQLRGPESETNPEVEPLKIQEPVNFKTAEGFGTGYPGPRSPTQQEYAQSEMVRGNGSTAGITCPAIRMRYPTSCHCCIVGMRSQAGQGFTWKRGTEQAHSTQPSAQFCHCNPDFVLICVTSFLFVSAWLEWPAGVTTWQGHKKRIIFRWISQAAWEAHPGTEAVWVISSLG